ncbi:MAG: hypothetical protein KZQ99_19645 [Candidatus Thiodiazotropha sp. (ex Dulcina madagascariensis)]|nr:hypothetical protein [Candidatus Thiodiazotropha sp. (ex Dulcina madagascariensis)]
MVDAYNHPGSMIARAYDLRSGIYDKTVARSEFKYHLEALRRLDNDV